MKRTVSEQSGVAAHGAEGRSGGCRRRRRSPASRRSGRRTSRTSRSTTRACPIRRIADIAAPGEPGPRLQGRDVGGRPSGPAQPHGQRPELDRHRRHGDLADQGGGAAGRDPGRRDRQDQELGQADAALHGRHFRRQGSLAPRRLAVRDHVSRRRRTQRPSRPARPTSRRSCRASTTPTRWASGRTWSGARSPAGPTCSRPISRARRRSRTSRPTASWTR